MSVLDQVLAAGKQVDSTLAQAAAPQDAQPETPVEAATEQQPVATTHQQQQPEASADMVPREEYELAMQRWSSLQGIHASQKQEIERLTNLLATVQQPQPAQPQQAPAAQPDMRALADEFGQEYVDMVRTVAAQVVSQAVDTLRAEMAALMQHVKSVEATSTKSIVSVFEAELTRRVPNWAQLDSDPEFLAWVNQEEGMTGQPRLAFLQHAYKQGDVDRTARFFEAFINEKQRASQEVAKRPDPAKFATPGKARSTPTPAAAPVSGRTWTREEVAKLYQDRINNRISSEEFKALEADLYKAQTEGRIR